MNSRPVTLDAVRVSADEGLWRRLVGEGRAAYRVEARGAARRRTHLQSAKVLDGSGRFLCEAAVLDISALGLRLLLAKNCGVPARFGVHIDLTGEVATAVVIWRRDSALGARILSLNPPAPLKRSFRSALRSRYYAVSD